MCGIIGYIGKDKKAKEVLIKGLKNLEYRGYDSAGIALLENDKIKIIKEEGKIKNLEKKVQEEKETTLGIGHTRWATHGNATKENAHPHKVGKVTLVHNGIIENYEEIKNKLNYKPVSNTDTEIACALINDIYEKTNNKLETLKEANHLLKGSYAFAIYFDKDNEHLYAMRKDSPLIIAKGENENFLSSDVPAVLEFTNKYILLDKNEYAVLTQDKIEIFNDNLEKIDKKIETYTESLSKEGKNGYEHYMIKEINDEPEVLQNILKTYDIQKSLINKDLKDIKNIEIIGCGSAYHAGLVGKYFLEELLKIPTTVYLASEYRYSDILIKENKISIFISQSGETADTLAALRKAKEENSYTIGIINTVGSSIGREADEVLYIKAGPEKAVATTKAYSAQVLVLELLALSLSKKQEEKENLKNLPIIIQETINRQNLENLADNLKDKKDIFFIGRKLDYYLSLEGALKLKEISYIHCEAYAAGELKHGSISLIEQNTPVISIVTDESIKDKTISNIKETKARGAYVILITTEEILKTIENTSFCDRIIKVKSKNKIQVVLETITILQLLSYEIAKAKKEDIDKPRNLAKSVTVE